MIFRSIKKLAVVFSAVLLVSVFSCAKIEHLAASFSIGKDEVVESGYGDDPASMIAQQTALRNSMEPFIDSETIYEKVYFGPNSAVLDTTAKEILWKKILWLMENPGVIFVIEGHSDSLGSEIDNLIMGQRRAQSVKVFFVEMGIPEEQLITVSYGEERLADPGKTEESRAKNRRVSFSFR